MTLKNHARVAGLVAALTVCSWALALPADPEAVLGQKRDGSALKVKDLASGELLAGATFNANADLRDADLSWTDLDDAVLQNVDLTGAVLRGANLRRAQLAGAILTRADLAAADLTEADCTGATVDPGAFQAQGLLLADTLGPDGRVLNPSAPKGPPVPPAAAAAAAGAGAAGADGAGAGAPAIGSAGPAALGAPAPAGDLKEGFTAPQLKSLLQAPLKAFFQKKQAFGDITMLALAPEWGRPKQLAATKTGLAIQCAGNKGLLMLNGNGWSIFPLAAEPVDLQGQGDRGFWYSLDSGRDITFFSYLGRTPKGDLFFNVENLRLNHPNRPAPGTVAVTSDSIALLLADGHITRTPFMSRAAAEAQGRSLHETIGPEQLVPFTAVVAGVADDFLFTTATEFGRLTVLAETQKAQKAQKAQVLFAAAPLEFKPNRMIQGPSRAGWCADLGSARVLRSDPAGKNFKNFTLASCESMADMAEGPGGKLWVTDPKGESVHCLDPVTETLLRFRMPVPGSMPFRIVNGLDGKMYFTLLGSQRLGAIMAEGGPAAPAAAEWPAPLPHKPKPQRKPKARPVKWAKPAKEADTKTAEVPEAEAAGAKAAAGAGAAPATVVSAAALSPMKPEPWRPPAIRHIDWAHIWAEHGWGAPELKGQFPQRPSLQAWLRAKILKAAQVRQMDPVLNARGNWELYTEWPEIVGYCPQGDAWTPTHKLIIVLNPDQDGVVTAYPVTRFP